MDSDYNPVNLYKDKQNINKEEIEYRHEMEEQVMNAITTGNLVKLQELMEAAKNHPTFDPRVIRIPEDYLEDRKHGLIIRNTFCRIAARKGGVPAVYIHLIAEKYSLIINNATSAHHLEDVISDEMFVEYCLAVQNFSTANYSDTIKEIISHITNHLSEPLSLNEVAETFHLNEAHLSRKFKKETGFTFIEYINHHRIEYAKLLFQEGNTSVTEVASYTGFNSSSYFSKVFKSLTGESPSHYLDRLNNE